MRVLADLFAADGVLEYVFEVPGIPARLEGQDAIRAHFARAAGTRSLLQMDEVTGVVHETFRVREGRIVHYQDYMDPLATGRALGLTQQLAEALSA